MQLHKPFRSLYPLSQAQLSAGRRDYERNYGVFNHESAVAAFYGRDEEKYEANLARREAWLKAGASRG